MVVGHKSSLFQLSGPVVVEAIGLVQVPEVRIDVQENSKPLSGWTKGSSLFKAVMIRVRKAMADGQRGLFS